MSCWQAHEQCSLKLANGPCHRINVVLNGFLGRRMRRQPSTRTQRVSARGKTSIKTHVDVPPGFFRGPKHNVGLSLRFQLQHRSRCLIMLPGNIGGIFRIATGRVRGVMILQINGSFGRLRVFPCACRLSCGRDQRAGSPRAYPSIRVRYFGHILLTKVLHNFLTFA